MRTRSSSNRLPVLATSTLRPKNKKTMPGKMEIKKYDPKARKHVIYKEIKLR